MLRRMLLRPLMMILLPLAIGAAGCSSEPADERVLEMARQQSAQQAQQHRQILEVHKELAEGTKTLVQSDAKAREELVGLQRDLQADQSEVGRQRDALESERREIARQRYLDPILASAITQFGLVLACLLPLVLGLYLIRSLNQRGPGDEAITEFLVEEIASGRPWLGGPERHRLAMENHNDEAAADDESDLPSD